MTRQLGFDTQKEFYCEENEQEDVCDQFIETMWSNLTKKLQKHTYEE